MDCWICGNNADSGEHRIKASDLKAMFGKVQQAKPIYMHTDQARNQRVAGLQSDKLKYARVLCSQCNNARTQASDKAWEHLSHNLQTRIPTIKNGSSIRLAKIFPGNVHQKMTSVHLFFVKQLGCLIAENDVPIELAGFSDAILKNKPHPNVYLRFVIFPNDALPLSAGVSPLDTKEANGKVQLASWTYWIDRIGVYVMYLGSAKYLAEQKGIYHPSYGARVIKFLSDNALADTYAAPESSNV